MQVIKKRLILSKWYIVLVTINTIRTLHSIVVVSAKPITENAHQFIHKRSGAVTSKAIRSIDHLSKIRALLLDSNNGSTLSNDTDVSITKSLRRSHTVHRNRMPVILSGTPTTVPSPSPSSGTTALIHGMKNAIASACAAACCKAILQPIDAMKTVQQYYVGQQSLSLYNAAQMLLQKPGGYKNLYAGLGITMIGSMPSVGLYFGVYSYCKQRFLATETGHRYKTGTIALSAAIGNTVASATRVPYEVMKQYLQTGLYDSTWSLFRDMIHHPNTITQLLFPKGGIWIQMIRDVPYAVVTLLLYESLQHHFGNTNKTILNRNTAIQSTKSPLKDALLGGFAGGVGSWVTNPMDVIKTRLQTDTNGNIYSGSVVKCFNTVWKEGGASAFLRGSVPRLVHKVPANAFFFLFYEFFRRLLHT